MSEQSQHETHRCGSVGYLLVAGRRVGLLRCELDAGHDIGHDDVCYCGSSLDGHGPDENHNVTPGPAATPHRASLEWTNDDALAESWPEALDVDETFDIEVPVDSHAADYEPDVATCQYVHDFGGPNATSGATCSRCGETYDEWKRKRAERKAARALVDDALDRKQGEVFRKRGWRGEIPYDYDGTPHSA